MCYLDTLDHKTPLRRLPVLLCLPLLCIASVGRADLPLPATATMVTNLQPVDAPAYDSGIPPYNPGDPTRSIYMEKVTNPYLLGEDVRLNVDVELMNNYGDFLRLDEMTISYPGHPLPEVALSGDQILAMPESVYTIPLKSESDKDESVWRKRPALTNGGFAVTGLLLERFLDKDELLPYGRAWDVRSYILNPSLSSSTRLNVVVGSRVYVVGGEIPDGEVVLPSDFTLARQGYVAKYDENGFLKTSTLSDATELQALADLGDGTFLIAGFQEQTSGVKLTVERYRLYEWSADKSEWEDVDDIEPVESFADGKGVARIGFYSKGPCDEVVAQNIAAVPAKKVFAVSATLRCGDERLGGLALLDENGRQVRPFGRGGKVVFSGPDGAPVLPVGVYAADVPGPGLGGPSTWLYVGAAVGEGCLHFFTGEGCQFGLARFDPETGRQDKDFGWHLEEISGAQSSTPFAMTSDGTGRFVLGGRALYGEQPSLALMRFNADGTLDPLFDGDGKVELDFGEHGGMVRGLAMAPSGRLAAAVESYEMDEDGGQVSSFATALFDQNGTLIWEHSPYASNRWTLNDESDSFDYGHRGKTGVQSVPRGITVDDRERILMAGVGIQPDLSDGPVVPGESGDYPVGGPGMMALARYLPSGAPDDRRWIRDQERRRFIIPEDRDLKVGDEFPDQILIALKFEGFEPVEISRDLVSYYNQEQFPNPDQPPSIHVSYYFPLAPWTLDNENEAFYVKSHPLDHHHRNASGNRFAYDIFVRRWDGESWTELVEGGDDDANEDYLIWGRQVRSIGNGMVVECRRAYPDNAKPGEVDSSDANYLKIQYASSPFLVSDDEYVSFLHFQQDSIPEALCPLECPADNADCDVDTEGVIVHPVEVVLGQFLGLAGNSGHSTGAHLHIHLTTGAPNAGSYPLSFHDVIVAPDADSEGTPQLPAPESWHLVDERGIPHGVLLRPIL